MNAELKEADDQKNSESEGAHEKWERFREFARKVLSLTPEEAKRVRIDTPEPKDDKEESN